MPERVKRITIIGLGLVGGSLGRGLVDKGYEVTAVDRNCVSLEVGLRLGAASRVTTDLLAGIKDAQVIILAAPVGALEGILREIAPYLKLGSIVSDVGSVKGDLTRRAKEILPQGVDFVGGHPMAGTEQVGIEGADPLLLQGAYYVLTPGNNCSQRSLEVITGLVKQLGSVPVIMDAVRHDFAVATLSHLPHLLAVALAQAAGDLEREQPGSLVLAAGSFRDATRVAESSPLMWQDICVANSDMILKALATFRASLDNLEQAIKSEDGAKINSAFVAAGQVRSEYKSQVGSKLAHFVEIAIDIPNRPGALGTITKALGEANINIIKIEVKTVIEGMPGSVVLGLRDLPTVNKAREVLSSIGIEVALTAKE